MTGRPTPAPEQWLMQPPWMPALRAGIGTAVVLSAVTILALTWPWRSWALLIAPAWMCFGVFLIWAGRYERSGTRLEADAITVIEGRRPRRLERPDILDLRPDAPGERAWRVQAVLRDGQVITLLGVPPSELERLRRWHLGL